MQLGSYEIPLPRLVAAGFGVAVLLVLVVAASTSGGAFASYNPGWEGLSEVQTEADRANLETTVATESENYDRVFPQNAILLLIGPEDTTSEQRARLRTFVEAGGTVVLASQDPEVADPVLSTLGTDLQIDGDPLRDEHAHDASPDFPLVTSTADHPYVANAEGMALNHGTAVMLADREAATGEPWPETAEGPTSLARTSDFSYMDRDGDGAPSPDENLAPRTVVAVQEVGNGEVVAVSDPSAFINVMLEREPNRAFVAGLFGEHERLVLDQSGGDVPPLVQAIFLVRTTPVLAVFFSLALVLAVVGWERRPHRRLRERWRARTGSGAGAEATAVVDRDAIAAYVDEQYPDLDERRRERVLGGIATDGDAEDVRLDGGDVRADGGDVRADGGVRLDGGDERIDATERPDGGHVRTDDDTERPHDGDRATDGR